MTVLEMKQEIMSLLMRTRSGDIDAVDAAVVIIELQRSIIARYEEELEKTAA